MTAIVTEEVKAFVNSQKLGLVATVCPDGTPNLSPKGTVRAWDDEYLVFADIHSPGTTQNLLTNPAIEINVIDTFLRKGYRFKGTAKVLSAGSLYEKLVAFYRAAGSQHKIIHIVLVKVDRVLEVVSPAYDSGVSEDEVRQRWIDYWFSMYAGNQTSIS